MMETILQIRLGDELYGIDSDKCNQILRIPEITSIPLSVSFFKGVSVLNGKVVNVIDLKELMKIGKTDIKNFKSRLVTVKLGNEEVGILVDEVMDAVNVQKDFFEENNSEDNYCTGFYKKNDELIQIIDPELLIDNNLLEHFEPLKIEKIEKEHNIVNGNNIGENKRFLFFYANCEKFAIDIDMIAELIFVPDEITFIAGSEEYNLGAITLRNEIINVFDFNLLFGFEKIFHNEQSRLLILKKDDKKLALLVEKIDGIKDISVEDIERHSFKDEKIESLYKNNQDIVSIINNDFLKKITDKYSVSISKETNNVKVRSDDMKELCVFVIGNEEFAFNIEDVQEIINYQEITPLPETNEYIEGIINLRGNVIVVINLPEKLKFNSKITSNTKIVVCNFEEEKIGFLVDEVSDIMFIEDKYVSISKNEESIVNSTISLNNGKRVILELKLKKIIDLDEIKSIELNKEINE